MPRLLPDFGTLFGRLRVKPHQPDDVFFKPAVIPGAGAAPELCQLASNERWCPDDHPADALVDIKGDGIRHLWIGGQQVTREGTPFSAASHVRPALLELERQFGKPMFFDGEYIHDDGLDAANADFKRGKGTGRVWLFDAVPLEQWSKASLTAPLVRRRELLLEKGRRILEMDDSLGAFQPFRLNGRDTLEKARDVWRLGFEGLLVKRGDRPYTRGRSTDDWWKLKQLFRAECRIVDVGRSSDGKSMRHLLVTYNGRTQKIGVGFTEQQRRSFVLEPTASHLGMNAMAVIEFAGETKGGLMREARFVELKGK
jgi:ATP-dependent DNA ligase